MSMSESLANALNRIQRIALVVAVVGIIATVIGAVLDPEDFFKSYLVGYVYWVQIGIGSLGFLMIHHVAGGRWSGAAQRVWESAAKTLPLMLVLFTPLIIGGVTIYEWADPEVIAVDKIVQFKLPYLNMPFFIGRLVFYFALWIGLTFWLSSVSRKLDETGDPKLRDRLKGIAGPGLLFFVLAVTFASFDWMMSLESHWFSSSYGVHFLVGSGVTTLGFTILMMNALHKHDPFKKLMTPLHFSDYGNFLLGVTMLWAYLTFSQYLIQWSGNLAEETPWYLTRTQHGWELIAYILIIFHFILPLFLLMPRGMKRNPSRLIWIAGMMMLARPVDLIYLIVPAFYKDTLFIPWMNFATLLAVGGIWVATFVWQFKRQKSIIPLNDERTAMPEEVVHGQPSPAH